MYRGCFKHFEPGYCDVNRVYEEPEAESGRADDESRHADRAVVVHTAVVMMMERYRNDAKEEKQRADKSKPCGMRRGPA